MRTSALPISLAAALFTVVSYGIRVSAAPKPPKVTSYPTVAQFSVDGIRCGITHDGRGPYYDGIDGVSSYRVAGTRSWTGKRGTWDLDINGVEMRWIDPVPQAGSYELTTPADKTLTLSFDRVDVDTIEVTVANGRGSFAFDVTSVGAK